MRGDDETRDVARRAEAGVRRGAYGEGVLDEVTLPPADERTEAQRRDIQDPADSEADPEVLRDGGPTRHRGVMTTTGGTAGPASVRRRALRDDEVDAGKVAPTTTGDATTGGMDTPAGGSTSDASATGAQVGNFTER